MSETGGVERLSVQRKPVIDCQRDSNYFTMKTNWLLLLVLLVAASSCKKEEQADKQIQSQLSGQWELEYYLCGECVIPPTVYPQGNGNIIEFAKNSRFIRKLKDSITFDGRYAIITSKECNKSGNLALQTNETINGSVKFITFENSKLQLSTPGCYADGAISIYRRIE